MKTFPIPLDEETAEELAAYKGQTVVMKIGGNSINEDPGFYASLAEQFSFLQKHGVHIVLVHGGGPQIDGALKAAGITAPKRADGRRPTSAAAMGIVAKVLREMSEEIADALTAGGCEVFSAAAAGRLFIDVMPFHDEPKGAENRAGLPTTVDSEGLRKELERNKILVLHCYGRGPGDLEFNTNADDYAKAVAMALNAKRLVMATNVAGVLGADKKIISRLTPKEARKLFDDGTIAGGMIPKVESALRALEAGVGGIAIISAHEKDFLLKELLTHKGLGTLIVAE